VSKTVQATANQRPYMVSPEGRLWYRNHTTYLTRPFTAGDDGGLSQCWHFGHEEDSMSSAAKRYRLVLFLSIVANLVVGIIILFWPDSFTSFAGQPNARPDTWPRHWGMQLWAINILYLPGFWNPAENRFQNWVGIGVRLTFAAFFFLQGDGFVPMGIYDGVSGVLLLLCYLPVVKQR